MTAMGAAAIARGAGRFAMKQFVRVLMSGVLLAGMSMPVVAAAQAGYGGPRSGQYAGSYYGNGNRSYGNGDRYYENSAYRNDGYYRNGGYSNRGNGVGPGTGAAIGGIAGVVLGGLLGGGKGALIGGAAGAGIGAVAGAANQNSRRYGNGYTNYGYRRY
jgi:hypothetical protein